MKGSQGELNSFPARIWWGQGGNFPFPESNKQKITGRNSHCPKRPSTSVAWVLQQPYPRVLSALLREHGHRGEERQRRGSGIGRMEQGVGRRAEQGRGCRHLFKPVPPSSASETASLSWIFSLRVCQGRDEKGHFWPPAPSGKVIGGHCGS